MWMVISSLEGGAIQSINLEDVSSPKEREGFSLEEKHLEEVLNLMKTQLLV